MLNAFCALAGITTLAISGIGDTASAQDLGSRIDAYLGAQVEANGIPGLTAAVVRDGTVLYEGAFGVRSLGSDEELTPDHVFHFASVSKPFVATAILQLAEQGKLGLEDRVTEHLPYFRLADDRFRSITIRQMLNHTSGMVDVLDYEWGSPQYDEGAAERFVRGMATDGMLWAPGGGWQYSNMAFDLLGDLIAKVSGQSFEEYVQKNILDPIGMRESSFIYPEIDKELRTSGHVGTPPRVSDVYPYNRRHAPSSTLNSSVSQMVNWMLVNLERGELNGQRILARESYDLLWRPSVDTTREGLRVGLSWFLSDFEGHFLVHHGGSDTGFRSFILLFPDDGIGVVMASNWSGADVDALAREVARLVLAARQAPSGLLPRPVPKLSLARIPASRGGHGWRQHEAVACRFDYGTGRDRAMPLRVRRTRMSHEVMIPRSAAEGQEVNSRNADEGFSEHAGNQTTGVTGRTTMSTSLPSKWRRAASWPTDFP